MTRERLPDRRPAETFSLEFRGQRYAVSIGMFADGRLAEVFASSRKIGTEMDALARDAAVVLSIALQSNVPIDALAKSLTREEDGTPATIIGAVVDHMRGESHG